MSSDVLGNCVDNIENIKDIFFVMQVFQIQLVTMLEKIIEKLDNKEK